MPSNQIAEGFEFCSLMVNKVDTIATGNYKNLVNCWLYLASFPGPTQLFIACCMEKQMFHLLLFNHMHLQVQCLLCMTVTPAS